MKLKKTDINLLIMLIGVLIAVAAYFLVYSEYKAQTATIESENAVLATEVDELQKLADNKQMYIDETARMNEEMTEIMGRFPAGVLPEDVLMYAYTLENTQSVIFTSLAIDQKQLVNVATAATPVTEEGSDAVDTESGDAVVASGGLKETVFLYTTPVDYGFISTYRSIKDIMQGIVQGQDRMNIESLTLSYDGEFGCIKGTINTNIYTMDGTGKYYELQDISGIQLGVDDLFKSNPVLNIHTGNNDYEGEEVDLADGAEEEESEEDSDEEKKVSEEN